MNQINSHPVKAVDIIGEITARCLDCPSRFYGKAADFILFSEIHAELHPDHQIVFAEEKKGGD